jgi:transcriptional regulator with XRE-family HTH domain
MPQVEGIGSRIAEARLAAGFSQSAFARETGFALKTISSWENNLRHPKMANLHRLAAATDRDVSWFFEQPERQAA